MFTTGLPPSISQSDVCICDQNRLLFTAATDGSEGSDKQPAVMLITGILTSHYSLEGTLYHQYVIKCLLFILIYNNHL